MDALRLTADAKPSCATGSVRTGKCLRHRASLASPPQAEVASVPQVGDTQVGMKNRERKEHPEVPHDVHTYSGRELSRKLAFLTSHL